MKALKTLAIATFCVISLGLFAQKDYTVNDLVNYFKEIKVPFTSEQLYSTYSDIPYELSLKYFFKNDTAFSLYYYEIEDEDHNVRKSGYEKKKVFPRNFFFLNYKLLLIYELYSNDDDSETLLSFFDDKGKQIDSLKILYATIYSSPVLYNFVRSKVYEDKVIVFDYRLVYNETGEEMDIKTIIQVNHYAIDLISGKFIQTKTEERKSKYELYLFDEGEKREVTEEDPYYKY
jgi:hypothetical protein